MDSDTEEYMNDKSRLLFGSRFVFGVMFTMIILTVVVSAGIVFAGIVSMYFLAFPENRVGISLNIRDEADENPLE